MAARWTQVNSSAQRGRRRDLLEAQQLPEGHTRAHVVRADLERHVLEHQASVGDPCSSGTTSRSFPPGERRSRRPAASAPRAGRRRAAARRSVSAWRMRSPALASSPSSASRKRTPRRGGRPGTPARPGRRRRGRTARVDRDGGAGRAGQVEHVIEPAVDRAEPRQRAPAGEGCGRARPCRRSRSGHRQRPVHEVGNEQPRAGLPVRDRPPVGVDVLDDAPVLEQVDAVVVFALAAPEPLGRAVEVERADTERARGSARRHLGRAELAARVNDGAMPRRPGELLVREQGGDRGERGEHVRAEGVERLDQARQRAVTESAAPGGSRRRPTARSAASCSPATARRSRRCAGGHTRADAGELVVAEELREDAGPVGAVVDVDARRPVEPLDAMTRNSPSSGSGSSRCARRSRPRSAGTQRTSRFAISVSLSSAGSCASSGSRRRARRA